MKVENSIEEAVKTMEHWVEYEKNNKDKINKADELIYIQEIILSDYKRVLKENEYMHNELNKQQTTINKYAKENEELKILKSGIQTLQDLRIEDGKYIVMSKNDFLNGSCKHLLDDYISKQEIKDIINKIDYDIKKTKEIISNGRRNDYQIVRLRAMNTKSLDIKKRLQKLLESEE